jgi:TonB family protein
MQNPWRRRSPRYQASVPVEVTVLRSGIPEDIPGRALNVGPGGLGAVVATKLILGELVGVDFQLPRTVKRVETRARVRYLDDVRYGLEFVAPNPEQVSLIYDWARETAPPIVSLVDFVSVPERTAGNEEPHRGWHQRRHRRRGRRAVLWLAIGLVLAGLAGWLYWRHSWKRFEPKLAWVVNAGSPERVNLPGEVMLPLVTHQVVPAYPEAARQMGIEGVVVLSAVVGRDGKIVDVHALQGPDALRAAAVDAVRWWQFSPYEMKGVPVEVETRIDVEFRLTAP